MFDRDRGPAVTAGPDRWTINLATGAVAAECRDDRAEFPASTRLCGWAASFRLHRRHRGWVFAERRRCVVDPLYKQDRVIGSSTVAPSLDPDPLIGEMARANPSARAEDDGILCGCRLLPAPRRSQPLLLGCPDEPIATVRLLQWLMGFHGNRADHLTAPRVRYSDFHTTTAGGKSRARQKGAHGRQIEVNGLTKSFVSRI